jgi:hypothetical protein
VCHEEYAPPSGTAYRDLAILLRGVIGIQNVSAARSRNTDAASSKVTRCFLAFAAALTGSHSYVTPKD